MFHFQTVCITEFDTLMSHRPVGKYIVAKRKYVGVYNDDRQTVSQSGSQTDSSGLGCRVLLNFKFSTRHFISLVSWKKA